MRASARASGCWTSRADIPGRLKIELNALATRVLFDESNRAIGVEYLKGERLYRAHAKPNDGAGERRAGARLARGDSRRRRLQHAAAAHAVGNRSGRRARGAQHPGARRSPGVGRNLQDRYEVAVVNRMTFDAWEPLRGATFTRSDAQFREWSNDRSGVFTTNGVVLSVIARSTNEQPEPDLFCYGLIGRLPGLLPRLLDAASRRTRTASPGSCSRGTRTTRPARSRCDRPIPRDPPLINFSYFDEGNDSRKQDVKAVVEGVKLVRTSWPTA